MYTVKLVWRLGQGSLLLLALASFGLCACGTLSSLQDITPQSDATQLYYSGIRLDARIMADHLTGRDSSKQQADVSRELDETLRTRIATVAFRTLDLPFSFAYDTVLLPFHAWSHLQKTMNPSPPVPPEAGSDGKAEVDK